MTRKRRLSTAARQQHATHKARKAKARAAHDAQHPRYHRFSRHFAKQRSFQRSFVDYAPIERRVLAHMVSEGYPDLTELFDTLQGRAR